MRRQTRTLAWVLLATVIFPLMSLSASPSEGPTLTEALVDRLLNLPYGLANQRGLILRLKHVESVQFYGAGADSKFSFRRGQAVIPGGLSLRLRNQGGFSWASGTIRLKNPLNVAKYNSVVVWVRTTHPGLRFWIGVQDPHWSQSDRQQARTDVLPYRGFPTGQPVQLVIPFASIYPDEPVDYTRLSQLAFEFGEDTVGNGSDGEIEILGVAFVRQTRNIRRVRIVTENALVRAAGVPRRRKAAPAKPVKPTEVVPEPVAKAEPANRAGQTAATLLKMTEEETSNFFRSMGLVLKRPKPVEPSAAETSSATQKEWIQPYAREWPSTSPAAGDAAQASAAPLQANAGAAATLRWPAMAAGTSGVAVFAGALWVLSRRRGGHRLRRLSKIFHAVHWPFTVTEATSLARFQRDFWKGLAAERVKIGWLSVTGATIDKTSDEEFYGARFLERQVRMAADAGVRLFPSLSFARTVFHYESFLANPKLYHVRPVDEADRQLTDAELRVREKNAFPVWVPSFWQSKFNLPYRVLVEFGKAAGVPAGKSTVQYNLAAPELRAMAVRTLDRFAKIAPGARIEDAAALLSSRLAAKPARGKKDAATLPASEFWADVIAAVRLKNPDFLFVAAAPGSDGPALRALGFDYLENDAVSDAVVEQVRSGTVGSLERVLTDNAKALKDSIYDVTKLIRPSPVTETAQRQNLLSAIVLALLPGVLQHDDNLPDDLSTFIQRISRSTVLRKGQFAVLPTNSPNLLAFARWRRRALFIAVANLSAAAHEGAVRLDPIADGVDDNKLYLFNNAVHGTELLRNIINTGNGGPAMALWGQNLRDTGVNVRMPALSLKLFSVNLTRPIPTAAAKEEILATATR